MFKTSWSRAAAWRSARHHLTRRAPAGSLVAVASRICGLHAQLLSSAELSVWARVEKLDRGAVQRALWQERTLIKTWAMRGTLHLLPAVELPMWHGGLAASRRYHREKAWKKHFGITLDDLDRVSDAIAAALEGRVLTREELWREVGKLIRSPRLAAKLGASSWGTVLKPAAFSGRLCFGPSVGARVQFTHPRTWIASPRPLDDAEVAGPAIARRFLAAYGPASVLDLARWWGGPMAGARRWLAALGDELTPVEVDGAPAFLLSADAPALREPAPRSVRLLPAFDPYVLGASAHAEELLPDGLRGKVFRPQGWISPVLLVNGRMEGTWRHEQKGSRVAVTVEPFGGRPVAAVRRAAGEEAERLADFLGGTVDVAWTS